MTETFDIYSGKSKLFYICLTVIGIGIASGIIADSYPKYQIVFKSLFLLGLIAVCVFVWFVSSGKMIAKNGEMIISNKSIIIDKTPFLLKDVSEIRFDDSDYVGVKKSSDGSGNKIRIITKDNKTYNYRFVIKSQEQRGRLREILKAWNDEVCEVINGYYYG